MKVNFHSTHGELTSPHETQPILAPPLPSPSSIENENPLQLPQDPSGTTLTKHILLITCSFKTEQDSRAKPDRSRRSRPAARPSLRSGAARRVSSRLELGDAPQRQPITDRSHDSSQPTTLKGDHVAAQRRRRTPTRRATGGLRTAAQSEDASSGAIEFKSCTKASGTARLFLDATSMKVCTVCPTAATAPSSFCRRYPRVISVSSTCARHK